MLSRPATAHEDGVAPPLGAGAVVDPAPEERPERALILPPFRAAPRRPGRTVVLLLALAGTCFFYGLIYAFFTPYLLVPILLPLAPLGLVTIWAMPDFPRAPIRTLVGLFFVGFVLGVMWPNYLALALPGLPWITIARITGFPLLLLLLVCVSSSPDFRRQTAESLKSAPMLSWLVIAFTVLICLSVLISATPLGSIQALIVYLVGGTAIFFVAAFAFRKPGTIERWAALIWATAVALSIMCGFEHHVRHVLWAGHVPSFLKVNDKLMARYLAGGGRNYTGIYRSNGPFSTSLGMGEFLALATPFILQFLIGEYRTRTRIAAGLSIFVVFFGLSWTGSRTGIIGFLIALLLYVLIWGVRRWRAHRSSLLGPATVLAYPAIGLVAVALTFVSGRVHNFVWGNGATKSSNDARTQQWHMALPKILHRPWGYGIDRAGVTLNYHQPNGLLTIDIYWLALVLEYGILGALLFLAILASGVSYSARRLLRDVRPIRDLDFLNSTMAALAAFIVMAITFAGEDNLPIVYMILGAVAALTWRARNEVETPRERSVSAAPAIDAGLGRTRRRPVSADVS